MKTPNSKATAHMQASETKEAFDELVRRIVEAVHPLRILLFGSRVKHTAGPGSDFDLLVVVPDGAPTRQTARRLYVLKIGIDLAADFIVATPEMLEQYGDHPGLIYREILETGREIYARAA
ncbi:nucleotidyltransferase domain-containing protein [Rhodocaloribacter sp.]